VKGVLLFAFNNERVNYFKMAKLCAIQIEQFWGLPVCVVSDEPQPKRGWPKNVKFWRQIDRPQRINSKAYPDFGAALSFWNTNRHRAFELTPFDQTILIDTDLIISTTSIIDAWHGRGVSLTKDAYSVDGTTLWNDTRFVGSAKVPMYWATIVCFDKSPIAVEFFQQWERSVQFYASYSALHGFDPGPMRNDFAVTLAVERLKGGTQSDFFDLPYSIPTLAPGSTLLSLDPLIATVPYKEEEFITVELFSDVHVMNKKSLLSL
jgi:hypothetical protein